MSRKISVLMIAEKPALAKTLSTILSNGQMQCRKTRVCNVYEYKGSFLQHEEVQFKFTSVLGHVFEIEFDHREKWNNPPINMYDANVIKLESRPDIKMVDFLKREAKGCKYLVLWLDCDKEGENICFEIIDSLNDVMTISMSNPQTVFRAHFSAITSTDINEAFRNLRLPNRLKSLSVTARQELDLKIGCSFTRFQNSFFHRKYSGLRNMLISYGQCQIPTLAFCVNRYDEIQAFKPTSYWTLSAKIASFNQPKQLINVDCTYEREFNCNNIKLIYNYLKNIGEGKVVSVVKSKRTTFKPKALNTVEMLKIASSKLGISPHQTMQIAEKLYNDGFISYPRTETTQYPKNFDLIRILQMLCRSNKWGMLAQDIIDNGIIPPRPGHDAGDHPPITPMKVSNNNQPLMGDSWRLYEYIVQHFLATLALDMVHESTSIEIDINSKIFKTNFSYVSIYGFANYLPKTLSSLVQQNPPLLNVNDKVMVSKIMIKKHTTKSPGFLTESELISLMEKNGIGTDASIPNHINNICLRKYVNISTGRTLVPTKLGIILIRGYMKIDQELVMPTIRSKLESELNLIATGDADFETVLKKNIEYHRTKFIWFIRNIKQMDELFESSYETLLNELAQNSSNEKKNDSLSKIKEKGKVKGNEKGKGKIKGKGNIKGKKKKEKPKQRKSCLKKTLNRNQDLSTLSDQNRENAKKGKKKNGRQVKKGKNKHQERSQNRSCLGKKSNCNQDCSTSYDRYRHRDRSPSYERSRYQDCSPSYYRNRYRDRSRSYDQNRYRDRSVSSTRARYRDRSPSYGRSRYRDRSRSYDRDRHRDRSISYDRSRYQDRSISSTRARYRDRSPSYGSKICQRTIQLRTQLINHRSCYSQFYGRTFALSSSKLLITSGATISTAGIYFYLSNRSKLKLCCQEVIDDNGNGNETVSIKAIDEPKQTEIESNNRTHSLSVWTTIFHFLKPDLVWLFLSIPSAILAAYFNIKINLALGDLMNAIQNCLQSSSLANLSGSVFFSRFTELVKNPALNLFSIYMFQSLFTFVYLYSLFVLAEKTANRIRYELFSKFLSFELTFFDVNNGGNILSSLSNDVQDFKSSFKQLISLGIKNFAQIVGSVVTLYHISPKMTLIINLGIIPTMAIIGSQVGSRLRKLSKRLQNQLGNITNVAFESINNIRTVKMLGIEEILLGKFLTELRAFDRINQSFSTGFAMFQSLSNFAFNGIILITLLFGGYNLLSGEMSAGSLMSFLATTQTIQRSLFQLSLLYGHYFKVTSSMNRILDYLVIESPQINGTIIPNLIGNIEFKDVIFRYPKRPDYTVLKNINLKLDPGKVTALCGPSGSGKSTIAMLLESLYDLESGTISVDNVEIDQLDRRWLRNVAIGYISQEPVLFATTIKENIKYGKMDATDEEIERAARFANAHDFISNFPDGYDTVVGHQGAALSGGQRQRIAIARALIKDPKILILDEATSALDTESESLVKDALDKLMEGRTVLVIAHRLSTILDSDRIVVLDDGHILEHGTHGQLLKLKGKYYELVKKSLDNGSNEPNKLN